MDAAQALADLTEISSQIEAAILLDDQGQVLAASVGQDQAEALARAVRELVAAADHSLGGPEGRERLVQLQAATAAGSVFVVRDEQRLAAAVTVPDPTVGLIFYDLRTCLGHVAGEELAPKPARRAGSRPAGDGEA